MDGIITFGRTTENKISVTFNDQKTDTEKIVQALVEGGVTVRERTVPVP
jgi:hypothetical protein